MTKVENAPAAESKETEVVNPATDPQKPNPEAADADKGKKVPEADKKEVTAGEVLGDGEDPKDPKPKEERMVPEAVLLEYKKENKQLAKGLADLKALIESGGSKKEISDDLKALGEKHNVDPEFLHDFASAVRAQAKAEAEAEIKPLKEKDNAQRVEKIFTEHYDKTLEAMPEYKDIAQKDVIRALALDPKNKNKTFAQILESAYGHLITGKHSFDAAKPGGSKDNAEIDFKRAKTDTEYFNQIMANDAMKKRYNDGLAQRLNL